MAKGISLPKGGGGTFVLMVGDEGAILVQMQKKRVVRRLFAQSPEPNHTRALDEALSSMPRSPITILVDMMDQSYVRQTLPPVSSFSVGKIVKRRLDKDFSPDDIKGYLILGREKTGRKDWNYLMASLANPPLLQKWIAFAVERPNPFKGLGLVPLEAQTLLLAAEKKLLGKDGKALEWQIMVNHHKVGGFRQIVLRNGKLIFTRMAQPIGESVPEVIAGNIEQEMTNTIEYLKRLGLQDANTLSVIILAAEDIKKAIDPKNIKAGEYHFFTPYEMGQLLALADAAQPEDHFGDVVISAFIARRRKLLLALQTVYTRKLSSLAMAIAGTRVLAALAVLAVLVWGGSNAWDMLSTQQDTEQLIHEQAGLKSKLTAAKATSAALPAQTFLFEDVSSLIKIYEKRRYDPLAFINNLIGTLQDSAVVTSYHWLLNDPTNSRDADKRQIVTDVELHMIAPTEPHDQFIASATGLIDRIKKAFPAFEVTNAELPGVLSDNKDLKTVIGTPTNTSKSPVTLADTAVKVAIKGPRANTPAMPGTPPGGAAGTSLNQGM